MNAIQLLHHNSCLHRPLIPKSCMLCCMSACDSHVTLSDASVTDLVSQCNQQLESNSCTCQCKTVQSIVVACWALARHWASNADMTVFCVNFIHIWMELSMVQALRGVHKRGMEALRTFVSLLCLFLFPAPLCCGCCFPWDSFQGIQRRAGKPQTSDP